MKFLASLIESLYSSVRNSSFLLNLEEKCRPFNDYKAIKSCFCFSLKSSCRKIVFSYQSKILGQITVDKA